MAKRKAEQQLVTLSPPCKKRSSDVPSSPTQCPPQALHISPKRKRKLDPDSAPRLAATILSLGEKSHDDGDPEITSHVPCKKQRVAEGQSSKAPVYKCQNDEAFREFNSFEYWRPPLPEVDFSEISGEADGDNTDLKNSKTIDIVEEMDN
ncbi:uncharacterized protein C9orf40 homolog [Rhinophrynus dorsalis]